MSRTKTRLIFPGRSDGTGEKPPKSKLEKVTERGGITRWLEEVTRDEAKSRDWRKKLGLMLVQEMEKKSKESGDPYKADEDEGVIFMLHDFPDGYTLYEQHTIKPKEGAPSEERRDAYLYGHPGGEKKRFRTPKEFFEHLWWLSTDEEADPNNCTCPRCVPEDLHKEVEEYVTGKPAETKSTKSKPAVKQEQTASAPAPLQAASIHPPASSATINPNAPRATPAIAPIPPPNPATTTAAPRAQPRPTSSGRAAPKSHLAPSHPPEPRNQEQADDAKPNSFLYRVGEVVWFQKGQAWGLGILQNRSLQSEHEHRYTVQPLSYPNANCEKVHIPDERQLKPWYAYSPPNATHARLNQPDAINRAFNDIPWAQVMSGQLGSGEAEVDASIYAAKTVDRSYSPIDQIQSNGTRTSYNGIFIGAEKVWRGDAVRLKPPTNPTSPNALNPEILIITDIIESSSPSSLPAPDRQAPRDSVFVLGDRYTYAQLAIKVPPTETNPQQYLTNRIPTRIPTLPDRVAEDLMRQNRISVLRHQTASSWRLVATKQQVPLCDVRGRWYESLRMLPIINPGLYQQALNAGQIPDVGRSLNARGDSGVLVGGSPGYRFSHREAVLGGSVPGTFRLPAIPVLNAGSGSGRGILVGRGDAMDLDGQGGFNG